MKPLVLASFCSLSFACFGPDELPLDGGSSDSTAGATGIETNSGANAPDTDSATAASTTDQPSPSDTTADTDSTGEDLPQEPCQDACTPEFTAPCTNDGKSMIACEPGASGCFEHHLSPCGDGICVAELGCVEVFPADCMRILEEDPDAADDIYTIDPDGPGGLRAFEAVCDMSTHGGGWTLVAMNDATDTFITFDRNWIDYKNGFGELATGARGWIGNERLHFLTGGGSDLRVLHDQGVHFYENFSVANEVSNYQMVVSATPQSSDGGIFTSNHSGLFFSTRDADHDRNVDLNCGEEFQAGWWYEDCFSMSIASNGSGQVYWRDSAGAPIYVQRIEMWVR